MLWPVLQNTGCLKPPAGQMHLLLTVGKPWLKRLGYWGISLFVALMLAGCNGKKEASYSQDQLNDLVSSGYLSPQMLTLDFQPLMVVQLYLEKPELKIQNDMKPLAFQFKGKLDAEILGGPVTEFLPVSISGQANLKFDYEDQVITLDQVQLENTQVDLDVMLIKAFVLDQLQKHLSAELPDIPVISLSETPELEQYLVNAGSGQKVNIFTFEQKLLFEIEEIQP